MLFLDSLIKSLLPFLQELPSLFSLPYKRGGSTIQHKKIFPTKPLLPLPIPFTIRVPASPYTIRAEPITLPSI